MKQEEYQFEEEEGETDKSKKYKEDMAVMRETIKGANKDEYLSFQEKVANILEEQEEIFVVHMAAMKEDARLLSL